MTNPSDFPVILSGQTERGVDRLARVVDTLDRYEADEIILKSELKDLNDNLYRVFDDANKTLLKDRFANNGRCQELDEHEYKLNNDLFMPYVHVIAGYLKKAVACKTPGAYRDAAIALYSEATVLAQRALALKVKVGKRPPSRTSKTAIAQDERDAKALTCQICARGILAETGQIAHHGYRRPGEGYQTASCGGALHLPFEVDRAELAKEIEFFKTRLIALKTSLGRLQREEVPLSIGYEVREALQWGLHRNIPHVLIGVTRANWEEKQVECPAAFKGKTGPYDRQTYSYKAYTFDVALAHALDRTEVAIGETKAHLDWQQGRYDGWVQTHDRVGDAWVAR